MKPDPLVVADRLREIVDRPWPTDPASLADFERWHGLAGAGEDHPLPLRAWAGVPAYWERHRGEVSGVVFLLWSEVDPVTRIQLFRDLSAQLTQLWGPPAREGGDTGSPAGDWSVGDCDVTARVQGSSLGGVQVAVRARARNRAREEAAAARRLRDSHPLAALGAPADAESFEAAVLQTPHLTEGEQS